jgi:hypothetical protein
MDDLIAKLKAAQGPSDDIDVAISKLFGVGLYTYSLEDALTLVPNRCDVGKIGWDPSGNACSLQEFSDGQVHSVAVGYAVTLPLAVCIAALKAQRAIAAENAA